MKNGVIKYLYVNRICIMIFLCALIAYSHSLRAQQRLPKFNIVEFYQDQQATTALSKEFEKIDGSGSRMAIIKVMSADPSILIENLEAFMFNFGNMRHEVERHGDELWVYVQKNARTVTITRDGYAPIKKYDLKTTIKEGATYVMKITFDKIITTIDHALNKQILQIKINPAVSGALVSLTKEGEAEPCEVLTTDISGSVAQNLDFGTYFYEVKLVNYLPKQGRVKLVTSDSSFIETVDLTPNFGFLEIKDTENASGAKVFVNDNKIGTVPYKTDKRWDCGTYNIMLVKDLYKTFIGTFTIERGKTTVLSPKMETNFAETTLLVDGDADIYIDDVKKGTGKWVGPLKAGSYLIECKKLNHRPTQKRIIVKPDIAETIELDAPIPITGYLTVMSDPLGAKITIDEKDCGITPLTINDILIGEHQVEISMPGRATERRVVTIQEGKLETVEASLGSVAAVSFTTIPKVSSLYINGQYEGFTPIKKEMPSGKYNIKLLASGYRTYQKEHYIDIANPHLEIKLTRQLLRKNAFYLGADVQLGNLPAYGVDMGFYAGNVNVELFYMRSWSKTSVFWSSTDSGSGAEYPYEEKLPLEYCAGGKIGYGIIWGPRFRITPQLGGNYINVTGEETSTYVVTGTAGIRLELACTPHIGLCVTPEYSFGLIQGENYKLLSSVLDDFKKWREGFNYKIGLFFYF